MVVRLCERSRARALSPPCRVASTYASFASPAAHPSPPPQPHALPTLRNSYRVNIKQASGLPFPIDRAFVQYDFFGETFTTETLEFGGDTGLAPTSSPLFLYSMVHHIPAVTAEFLAWLQNPMEFFVHVSPLAQPPRAGITAASVKAIMDGGGASSGGGLAEENTSLKTENAALRQKLESVKAEIEALDLDGAVRSRIMAAIALDQALEGEAK